MLQGFRWLRANRPKLLAIYGENSVDFSRAVFLSGLGRSFAAMLVVVHLAVMLPGASLLDDATQQWLVPFVAILVCALSCSAWLVERDHHAIARYLTNFTVSASTMLSVVLCGGFLESHATPFLLAPIVVAFCISPPKEAIVVGTMTFFLPLFFDGFVKWYGLEITNYTSVSNPTANTIFLLSTLFITVFISLTYLQKTNSELHLVLDRDKKIFQQWATIDPLTEIGNRRAFDMWLEEALASTETFGVLYMDLNAFKPINDTYGHEVGDQILLSIAKRLTDVVGTSGSVARLGGDEFAFVQQKQISDISMETLFCKIHLAVQEPISIAGHQHHVSISIGKAVFPNDATDASDLLRTADMDMYADKMKNKLVGISKSTVASNRRHDRELESMQSVI